jgi:DNA replication ATP-dependent helicase Dna2
VWTRNSLHQFQQYRGQWQRSRNTPAFPHSHNHSAPPARQVVTGPPIMPSTQTRTKLKAFQFIEGAPGAESTMDKENLPVAADKPLNANETPKANKVTKDIEAPFDTPRMSQNKTFPPPSTPATRLPLADLVGNVDDSSRHTAKPVASPEEQLFWRGSQPTTTPILRRPMKRARSSSPVGPSQDDHRLDGPRPEWTTPQADPAMELWSRYTSNKGTPTANKSVAFAHLINESSPRPAAAAGSVSGLRRWASCGIEFPASNRKRRRTQGVFQGDADIDEDMFTAIPSSDSVMHGQQTKSNLADMVQRMKESISNSQMRNSSQSPLNSSPLPGNKSHQVSSGSPKPRRAREIDANADIGVMETIRVRGLMAVEEEEEDFIGDEDDLVESDAQVNNVESREASGSSDEFGDVDFDTDLAEVFETTPLGTTPFIPEAVASSQSPTDTHAKDLKANVNLFPTGGLPKPADSGDEFGMDDDDDVFTADLEHVVSMYDTRPYEAPTAEVGNASAENSAAPVMVIDLVDEDSDEFGDDIDADEFAAAEVAATQVPETTVCKTYPST